MKHNAKALLLAVLFLGTLPADAFSFRLLSPSSNTVSYSRATWEAAPGNWPFNPPAGNLNLTIDGDPVTVTFPDPPVDSTAQDVADRIQAAIDAQAPGSAVVTVVGGSLGTGAVRIEATAGIVVIVGGAPNADLQFATGAGGWPETTVDPSDPPPFVHWDLREFDVCLVPYSVKANATNTPLTPVQLDAAVDAAFQNWADVQPSIIGFMPRPLGIPGPNYFVSDDWNVVYWGNPPGLGASSGMTRWQYNNTSGVMQESDIVLNDDLNWVNTGMDWVGPAPSNWSDVEGISTHEIGHFIGLAHVPDADVAGDPTMSYGDVIWGNDAAAVPNFELRSLSDDDQDGCNWLYTPDLGDAPDPDAGFNKYQSLVHGELVSRQLNDEDLFVPAKGPYHHFGWPGKAAANADFEFEWLGATMDNSDLECEARVTNNDDYDDGVAAPAPLLRGFINRFTITVSTSGVAGRYDATDAEKRLYVNGYMDFDNTKVFDITNFELWWEGTPEAVGGNCKTWAASGNFVPPAVKAGNNCTLNFDVLVPATAPKAPIEFYGRFRLDYGEDENLVQNISGDLGWAEGAAQFGEVEDYPFTSVTALPQPYLVYISTQAFGTTAIVKTKDQFDFMPVLRNVEDRDFFMNPVQKVHVDPPGPAELIVDHDLHYTWNRLPDSIPAGTITVRVADQFSNFNWVVFDEPMYLLAPASKCTPQGCTPGVVPGDQHYQCYYVLNGPDPAQTVELIDQFPPDDLEIEVGPARWLCNPADKDHPPGAPVEFLIQDPSQHLACYDIPNTEKPFSFSARDQFSSPFDGGPYGNEQYLCVPALKTSVVDLSVVKTDSSDPVAVGTSFTYTLTVTNNDASFDATNVVLTDTLPGGVSLVSTSGCAEDPLGVPTCTLGIIGPGSSAVVTFTVNADTNGLVTNSASVSSEEYDPNAANDTVNEDTLLIDTTLTWVFSGTAQGGTIDFKVSGVSLQVITTAGQTAAQVAAAITAAINNNPTLTAAEIGAVAAGDDVITNGSVTDTVINDPGISSNFVFVPALSAASVILFFLLTTALLLVVRRRRQAVKHG